MMAHKVWCGLSASEEKRVHEKPEPRIWPEGVAKIIIINYKLEEGPSYVSPSFFTSPTSQNKGTNVAGITSGNAH